LSRWVKAGNGQGEAKFVDDARLHLTGNTAFTGQSASKPLLSSEIAG
jgi:hypothetical protein